MKIHRLRTSQAGMLIATVCLLAAISSQAAFQYYSGVSANKIWDTSLLDWGSTSGGPYNAAWVNGNDAVFQGTAATITNSGVNVKTITFSVANYVITNGVLTLSGTTPFITNAVAATIGSEIAGTAGLTKIGTAGLTLSASNSFSGVLTNNSGSANVSGIVVLNNNALGATGAGNETVVRGGNNSNGGNMLAIGNGVVTPAGETVILQCGASQRAGFQNVANAISTWSGDIVMVTPDTTAPVVYANGGTNNILGSVRGNNLAGGGLFRGNGVGNLYGNIWLTNSAFFVADGGVWTIYSNSNLWTYAQVNGGRLKLGTNDALCTSGALSLGQGNANVFTFDMNGFNQSVALVTNNIGSIVNLFTNSSANPSIFTVNATAANSRIAPSGAGSILVCGPISIVKNGSFQLSLGGANTYVGTNTVNGGTLLITNVGTLGDVANPLVVNAGVVNLGGSSQTVGDVTLTGGMITNGTLTANAYIVQSGTVAAVLAGGSATLTKTGNGTLILTNVNTYGGASTITGGKVIGVTGGSANSSAFTFAPGSGAATTNAVQIKTSGGQWSCATLTNTTANGGSIYAEFDYTTVAGPSASVAPLLVNGDGDVSGTLNIIVKGGVGWATGQSYPLLQFLGNGPAAMTLNLVGTPVGVIGGSLSYDSGTRILSYIAGDAPRNLAWIKGSGVWDINTTTNWLDASLALTKFQQLDLPTFDDSVGAGSFLITNNSSVNPSSVTFNNSAANYTLIGNGAITGNGALTKSGTGSLTIASANTYLGGTVVSNGTLVLANTAALSSGALDIEGGAIDSGVANLINGNNNPITLNNNLIFLGSQNLDLGGSVLSFSANRTVAVSNNTLTVSTPVVSGTSLTLTKEGPGVLRQGANNALGGESLTVNEGSVDLNGYALTVNGFNGGTNGIIRNNGGSGQVTLTLGSANGGGTFSGLVADNSTGSGTIAVAKIGTGGVTLASSNSYSGPTTISGAGLLVVAHPYALGTTNSEITQPDVNNCVRLSGNIVVPGRTINIQGTGGPPSGGNGNGSLQGAAGQTNEWAGTVRSGAGTQSGRFGVAIGTAGLLVISGPIQNGGTASGAGLDVVANCDSAGSGVMFSAPAGANTYAGQTQVGRGILKLGATNTLPVATVLNIGTGGSGNAAMFDLNGFDQMVGGLTRSSSGVAGIVSNSIAISTNTLTVNQSAATSYSGTIAGANVNLIKTGSSQLTLLGANSSFAGLTTVSNGTLLVMNELGTSPVTVNGGVFGGVGPIGGPVSVNAGGTLSPGTNGVLGTLTLNGDLTLNAGSTNIFEVDGTTPANDQVSVSGNVTYGGVLNIVTNGSFNLGQTFTLFTGGNTASTPSNFSSITGSPGSGLAWSFTNGVLSVVTAASYANYPTNITATVSGNQLTLTWPATHLGWILQSQTNALSVGLTTATNTWFDVPNSDLSTQAVINVNPANPTVFYRIRMP